MGNLPNTMGQILVMAIKIISVFSCCSIVIVMYWNQNTFLSVIYHVKMIDEYMMKFNYKFSYTPCVIIINIILAFAVGVALIGSNVMSQLLHDLDFFTVLPNTILHYLSFIQRQILSVLFVIFIVVAGLRLKKINSMLMFYSLESMKEDELLFNINFIAKIYSKLVHLTEDINNIFAWALLINMFSATLTISVLVLYLKGDPVIDTDEMILWFIGNVPITWITLMCCHYVTYKVITKFLSVTIFCHNCNCLFI